MIFKLLTAVLLATCVCEAYKILVMFPIPGKSHGILGEAVVRHLLSAGHEVTYISGFPRKNNHPKLTHVHSVSSSSVFNENTISIKAVMDKEMNLKDYNFVQQLMVNISTVTLADASVQALLKDPMKKFDVVFAEWVLSEVYATVQALYNCPFIWFSLYEPHYLVTRLIDEPMNPAYNADIFTAASAPYSFMERVNQLWIQVTGILRYNRFVEIEKKIYESNLVPILEARGEAVPAYEDLVANISLMLGNSHVSLGLASRLPQNYKPVGGYHIDKKPGPLPENLQKLLDNAKHGVIYFSMGSSLKSKDIPDNLKKGFLKTFSGLKQTVLWKFEEVLPNLPKNVHIVTWAPQQSILAHPNCVLFITHGGLLSTSEAVHYGKPIIGIPVFADQFANVLRAVEKGFGRKVDLTYTMDADFKLQIEEILGNPSCVKPFWYAQKAKEWSLIYHDRLATPGQELIHWTEHVIKTGGAKHLRSPALLVPWYQKLYLDLLALVIVAIVAVNLAVLKVIRSFSKVNKKKRKVQ